MAKRTPKVIKRPGAVIDLVEHGDYLARDVGTRAIDDDRVQPWRASLYLSICF